MRCEDVERNLDDRTDGLLSPENESALEEHLESCEACRELAADLDAIGDEVCRLNDALPIRPSFAREVMDGVSKDEHRRRRSGMALVGAGVLAAAAAVLLLTAMLRTPLAVRVTGTEGGFLRLDASEGGWRGIREGERLNSGSWALTFPDRRARIDLAGATVLLEGDVLASLAPDRVDLLHGRLLLETTDRPVRVVTPFGAIEGRDATVELTVRYGSDPVFRVQADGAPRHVRSLLALASTSLPDTGEAVSLSGGHLKLVVLDGAVTWQLGETQGHATPGTTYRFGPGSNPGLASPTGPSDWMSRPFATMTEEDRALTRSADPVGLLVRLLSAPAAVVREVAAARLGRLCGGSRAVTAVAERLAQEGDAVVRRSLLDALRRLDATERAEDVLPSLRDSRPEVREAALRCWLDLKGAKGIDVVGGMIDDPESHLRVLALRGLRLLGDSAARPWAEKALKDADPAVSGEARRVLETLDGQE